MKWSESVPVSELAVFQRINRKLAADPKTRGATLKKTRQRADKDDGPTRRALGEFYIVNRKRKLVVEKNVNIEHLARALGVLQAWEVIAK